MPLRDHFHSPWSDHNHWESFHSAWANTVVRHLNLSLLPPGYRALPQVHLGALVETDVGAFEENGAVSEAAFPSTGNGGGTTSALWAPPKPAHSHAVDFINQDIVEVRVHDEARGMRLVGAIEFVGPGNKDRPESRRAFVLKCAGYLQEHVGLIVVDIVTERRANLHRGLLQLLDVQEAGKLADLYAVAYSTQPHDGSHRLDTWPVALAVTEPLPTMPLWLKADWAVPLELEKSYEETAQVLRIG